MSTSVTEGSIRGIGYETITITSDTVSKLDATKYKHLDADDNLIAHASAVIITVVSGNLAWLIKSRVQANIDGDDDISVSDMAHGTLIEEGTTPIELSMEDTEFPKLNLLGDGGTCVIRCQYVMI